MKNLLAEFKAFVLRGNVLDLAVAVVVGAAFTAVVNSLANDVLLAFVAAVFGEPAFDAITLRLGEGEIRVGSFLNALVTFLIVAASVFVVVKAANTLATLHRRGELDPAEEPEPSDEVVLLGEIRDILRDRR